MRDHAAATLVERIRQDQRAAMKQGYRVELSELRTILARIANAEAVPVSETINSTSGPIAGATAGVGSTEMPRRELSLADVRDAIAEEIDEIDRALTGVDPASRHAGELAEKREVARRYLPGD